jgi:hypothetical protein
MRVFCVKYPLRLKKQFSIRNIVQQSRSRLQHSDYIDACFALRTENRRMKEAVTWKVNMATLNIMGFWVDLL